jgi:sterol desaturase/sphingolipid hydroxylase (fatty acid hydroxylase superfamily)
MDAITISIIVFFLAFLAYDTLRPARRYTKIKGWVPKGIVSFVVYATLSTVLPFVWDAWLGQYRLIDATSLGTLRGAGVGFLSAQAFVYVWHRLLHGNDFLWKWSHQMHHSAERIDVAGTFYFSPLDMVGFTFLGSLALVWAVGVTPQAAVVVNVVLTFTAMFTHANIRTPQWLGYFISRPEMHAIHHERGSHSGNYCDLPVIDMIFGTYRNPETFEGEAGFYDGASARVVDMLLGRDVSVPAAVSAAETVSAAAAVSAAVSAAATAAVSAAVPETVSAAVTVGG